MQEAFRPEHMRQEAECARVDFPCSSPEQDLRKGKMMTMTLYPPQRYFCIVALAQPVLLLYYLFYFKSFLLFTGKAVVNPCSLSFERPKESLLLFKGKQLQTNCYLSFERAKER